MDPTSAQAFEHFYSDDVNTHQSQQKPLTTNDALLGWLYGVGGASLLAYKVK